MFDQITRTATDLANGAAGKAASLSTSAGDTATKVSTTVTQSARSTVSKIKNVQLDMTNLDLSGLGRLDPRKVDLPKFDMPKFDMPTIELPKVDLPKVGLPEVDVPAEVDRVADLVRDVAYAGLGAAVITAQQVDANVRRLASRSV